MNRKDKVDKLFEENMKLVYFVVEKKLNKNIARYKELGVENEDLHQLGFIGLFKACQRFKDGYGAFSTYAVPLIYGEIANALRDEPNIKIPREALSIALKIKQKGELNWPPVKEIMEEYDVSEYTADAVIFALNVKYRSFEMPVTDNSDGREKYLSDIIPTNYDLQLSVENKLLIQERLSALDEIEKIVVFMTLNGDKQREIAKKIGVSQPSAGRIYKRAMLKLKEERDLVNV